MLKKVASSEVSRFIIQCMESVGTPKIHAEALAAVLVSADERGHLSHGLNRLEIYVNDVKSKMCDAHAVPAVLKESASTAWVDGQNGLGPVVGNFCMDLAISKAKKTGVGWVVAKGSNHYGMAAHYSMQAMCHHMVGFSATNTSPFMAPTRSKLAALGTNPLTVAAPAKGEDSFVLDMATTAVAVGKIEVQIRKGEKIPEGWAQDVHGNTTTNALDAYNAACLMPLGGTEETSGFKGYGLGVLVELLCGICADSDYGINIRKWKDNSRTANLGQCFIALNIQNFAPGFEERMGDLNKMLRNLPKADPSKPVLVAGDRERMMEKSVKLNQGIYYPESFLAATDEMAKELNVRPLSIS